MEMVAIWKIGAWPGLWERNTAKNKKRFIEEYALPKGFVAIGYGWIPNIKQKELSEEEIKKKLREEKKGKIERRTKEILKFANEIKEDDVILLYKNFKEVYVGIVIKPYYFIESKSEDNFIVGTGNENIAPHRIGVEWQFNKKPFSVDFSKWQDTVHQVKEEDLINIEDKEIKNYLLEKIHAPLTGHELPTR